MKPSTNPLPETWAVVELMGHVRLAGRLSEVERFGGKLARLDVPIENLCGEVSDNFCPRCGKCSCRDTTEGKNDAGCPLHGSSSDHGELPKFVTKFFGASAVYQITFVTERVAQAVAKKSTDVAPVQPWDYPQAALTAGNGDDDDGRLPFD